MSILSPVEEIQQLQHRFAPGGTRPRKCEAFVVIDRMVIARLPDGLWWCSWPRFDKYARMLGGWNGQTKSLLTGLNRLGLLSNKGKQEHIRLCDQRDLESSLRYAQSTVDRLAKEYGFKAPKLKKKVAA